MISPEGRIPPYDIVAETACLGAIILDKKAYKEVSQIISVDDFYSDVNRRIYKVIQHLFEKNIDIDHITIADRLREVGDLERVGGVLSLSKLTDAVAAPSNVDHYARIVRKKSQMRSILYASQNIVAHIYGGVSKEGVEDDDLLAKRIDIFNDAVARYGSVRMPDSLFAYGNDVVELYEKVKNGYTGIPLPWDRLTELTMGMWPGTMTVFVARPKIGKSMVCVLSARYAWSIGNRVLVVSPEMSKLEMAERFFVIDSGISYGNVIKGTLTDPEFGKLKNRVDDLKVADNLWIMDSTDDLSGIGIESAIRACRPQLVAVDSIYMLRFGGDKMERAQAALNWLGVTCKRYDFASVAFSQLNRGAEVSEKKGGGIRLGTIALTDQMGWDAHAVFALEQDKDMKADKIMTIRPLAARRSTSGLPYMIKYRWDFDDMDFTTEIDDDSDFEDEDPVPF